MSELRDKLIECPVCLETYDSVRRLPRTLPCVHSLCLPCAARLLDGTQLRCPECRREFSLPGGVRQLPGNPTLASLVEEHERVAGPPQPAADSQQDSPGTGREAQDPVQVKHWASDTK